jgi:hypothetical protein
MAIVTFTVAVCLLVAFHKSVHGLPLDEMELDIFRQCTGRQTPRPDGYQEIVGPISRRAGKTLSMSQEAVYLACFRTWPGVAGERRVVLILAATVEQARNVYSYCRPLITEVPALNAMLIRETATELDLSNGITIEIVVNDYRSIRGSTICAAICDETAFWDADGSNPDREVLIAIRAGMASVKGAMLFIISSPYAKMGVLWDLYRRYYGAENSRVLVWKAASRTMNPSLDQAVIDQAMEADPASARSEFLGEFRDDIASFASPEVIAAVTIPGRYELPRLSDVMYVAFCDPSGGSHDSMTMAIAHRDKDGAGILDCVREVRPPFSPESVVEEFAALLKAYGLRSVTGDRYAGEWPRERFRQHGIRYEASERTKSDIYKEALPLLNGARVELLDHPRLISQLCSLERRTARGGRDSVDHPPQGRDDVANACAGALVLAAGGLADGHSNLGLFHAYRLAYEAQQCGEGDGREAVEPDHPYFPGGFYEGWGP